MKSAAKQMKADYYAPHLTQASDGAAAPPRASGAGTARSGPACKAPRRRAMTCAQAPGTRSARTSPCTSRCWAEDSAANPKPTMPIEAALLAKELPGKPVKVAVDAPPTTCSIPTTTPYPPEHLEAGLDKGRQARRMAASQRRPDPDGALFGPDSKLESPIELAAWGSPTCPSRSPTCAIENPEASRAYAHRPVPPRVEHSACVRDPVVRGRARARRGPRSEGLPARAPGPPRQIDPAAR